MAKDAYVGAHAYYTVRFVLPPTPALLALQYRYRARGGGPGTYFPAVGVSNAPGGV